MLSYLFLLLCFLLRTCSAHMVMAEPPPINYKTNPHYNPAKGDMDYTAPLSPSGSNYPCRGHLKDLAGPEGQSVRTYEPGGSYELRFDGSAVHGGGSCQCSLSYDGGVTFKTIKSFIGNCPDASAPNRPLSFTIPSDAPGGNAIFAWTWFNKIGNREMYMNCAVVTISGGRRRVRRQLSGPNIFVANVGNGCGTTEGTDVVFPQLGDEVEYGGNAANQGPPSGTCNGVSYAGGGATGGTPGSYNGGTGPGTGGGSAGGETTPQNQDSEFGGGNGEEFVTTYTGAPAGPGTYAPGGTRTGTGGGSSWGYWLGGSSGDEGSEDTRSCAYWRARGYVCAGAPPGIPRSWWKALLPTAVSAIIFFVRDF